MIGVVLLAAQSANVSAVLPEEFRRKVALHHMCLTDDVMEDTGYRELGLLYLERGDNLPNVALTRKGRPALFEKGVVTEASGEKYEGGSNVVATLAGEREGKPANLTITLQRKEGDGMAVKLMLSQDGRVRNYRCVPDIRKEQEQ